MRKENYSKEDVKEDFCGACVMAVPAALGITGTTLASKNGGMDKKYKKILLWSSVVITIISIILFIYYKRSCKSCR